MLSVLKNLVTKILDVFSKPAIDKIIIEEINIRKEEDSPVTKKRTKKKVTEKKERKLRKTK